MTCVICKHGETKPGAKTAMIDRDVLIVIRNVPSATCETCGEGYYTADVAERLQEPSATPPETTILVRSF